MVAFFESLSDDLRDWALEQQLFFIASAPLTGKHVNVSPKGLPSATFTFFDANHAAYIDMTGSGAETISHLYENGRATIMFCSFGKSPRIMRLFCTGRVIEYADSGYADALSRMGKKDFAGARAVILLDIWKVQTSCGFAVPQMSEAEAETLSKSDLLDRDTLTKFLVNQKKQGKLEAYHAQKNARSLDGLPSMKVARRTRGEWFWAADLKAFLARVLAQREGFVMGVVIGIMLMLSLNMASTERVIHLVQS